VLVAKLGTKIDLILKENGIIVSITTAGTMKQGVKCPNRTTLEVLHNKEG
jgi:hypothetical protein